jgi:type II secretory pathway pseudopilin PulG
VSTLSILVAVVVGVVSGVLASVITAASQRARDRRARRLEAAKLLFTYLRTLKDHLQGLAYYLENDHWPKRISTLDDVEDARRAAYPVKGYLSDDAQEMLGWIIDIDEPDDGAAHLSAMIRVLEPALANAFPASFYH